MRALIGAIIAAGALIGLGLTNLGLGLRYQAIERSMNMTIYDVKFKEIDNPLQFGIIFLAIMAMIGLGIAFVGLMYHHERRFHEAQINHMK
jgi:ABC-type Na+ efflux pump permease subunit